MDMDMVAALRAAIQQELQPMQQSIANLEGDVKSIRTQMESEVAPGLQDINRRCGYLVKDTGIILEGLDDIVKELDHVSAFEQTVAQGLQRTGILHGMEPIAP